MQYPAQQQQYGGTTRPVYQSGGWNNRIRPVSSIEEVRAASIDFDGSVFYFSDLANKRIYTKQITLDGMVQIDAYAIAPVQEEASAYVTKVEFQQAIQNLLEKMKGENNNEQSVPNVPEFNF